MDPRPEPSVEPPSPEREARSKSERAARQDRQRDLRDAAIAVGLVAGTLALDYAVAAAKRRAKAAVRRRVRRAIRKRAVRILKNELKRAIDEL